MKLGQLARKLAAEGPARIPTGGVKRLGTDLARILPREVGVTHPHADASACPTGHQPASGVCGLETLVQDPPVFKLRGLLTAEECDYLISLAKPLLRRSRHGGAWTEKYGTKATDPKLERRTSFTAMLGDSVRYRRDPRILPIIARLAAITRLDVDFVKTNLELQIVRYEPGQYYRPHLDPSLHVRRYITIFTYLNEVEGGGQTALVKLPPSAGSKRFNATDPDACAGLLVEPEMGSSAMWYNFLDGEAVAKHGSVLGNNVGVIDMRTKHAGCDVTGGVKYGANMWIHDTLRGGRKRDQAHTKGGAVVGMG